VVEVLSIAISSPFSSLVEVSFSMSSGMWPRTSRPLGMNFRLSGLGVVAVWMKRERHCCCCDGCNCW